MRWLFRVGLACLLAAGAASAATPLQPLIDAAPAGRPFSTAPRTPAHFILRAVLDSASTMDSADRIIRENAGLDGYILAIGSAGGLGRAAPNPVLSTLRCFREEYDAHVRDHRCPAGVCKALITYEIDQAKCDGCHACVTACSTGAITGQVKYPHLLNKDLCIKCGACMDACKREAVLRA